MSEPRLVVLNLVSQLLGIPMSIATKAERKLVQKAVYLAQLSGTDLGYGYGWYIMGPYSTKLTRDYYELAANPSAGELEGKQLHAPYRTQLERLRPLLSVPNGVSLNQPEWLELLASIAFLCRERRYDRAKVQAVLAAEKPRWRRTSTKAR